MMNTETLSDIFDKNYAKYELKAFIKNELLKAINEAKKFVTVGKGKSAHPIPAEWLQKAKGFQFRKKAAAWDILSVATGKNKKWLKMQYRKSNEFILNLLEKTDDKLELGLLDDSIAEIYPELHQLSYQNSGNDTVGIGSEIAHQAYQDLLDDNFYDGVDDTFERENEQALYELEQEIKALKNKIKSQFVKDLIKNEEISEESILKILNEIDNADPEKEQILMDDLDVLEELYKLQKYL